MVKSLSRSTGSTSGHSSNRRSRRRESRSYQSGPPCVDGKAEATVQQTRVLWIDSKSSILRRPEVRGNKGISVGDDGAISQLLSRTDSKARTRSMQMVFVFLLLSFSNY